MDEVNKILVLLCAWLLVGISSCSDYTPNPSGDEPPVGSRQDNTRKVFPTSLERVQCEEYLLERAERKAIIDTNIKKSIISAKEMGKTEAQRRWLSELRIGENIVNYSIQDSNGTISVYQSHRAVATGLASHFTYWLVETDKVSIEYSSLFDSPRLVFWSDNTRLRYYEVTYNSEFIENKDWDNLIVDAYLHEINEEGKSQIVDKVEGLRCN